MQSQYLCRGMQYWYYDGCLKILLFRPIFISCGGLWCSLLVTVPQFRVMAQWWVFKIKFISVVVLGKMLLIINYFVSKTNKNTKFHNHTINFHLLLFTNVNVKIILFNFKWYKWTYSQIVFDRYTIRSFSAGVMY